MFGRIDRNNANWGDVLFGHQISDSGFDIPLTEDAPKAIDDKIHLVIITVSARLTGSSSRQLLSTARSGTLSWRI
jgi:hypothetical protein